jgi:hypothetical protein
MIRLVRRITLLSLVLLLAGGAIAAAQAPAPAAPAPAVAAPQTPVEYVGRIINMQGGGSTYVTLHVDSFTPDDEILQYFGVIQKDGMPGLTKVLFDTKDRGWIKIGSLLGYRVAIQRFRPTDKGTMVVAVTDRPLQFFEQRNGTRSLDYPLGMLILHFPKDGKPEGTLIAAAKASFGADGKLELESYGTAPLKVTNIQVQKVKTDDKDMEKAESKEKEKDKK